MFNIRLVLLKLKYDMGQQERLLEFINSQGLTKSAFERNAGLSNGYVAKLKGAIGEEKLEGIFNAYPMLSKVWLLTGDGEMLNPSSGNQHGATKCEIREGDYSGTLVYNIDATCGTDLREMAFTQENVIGSVDLPGISKDSKIIRANGDSISTIAANDAGIDRWTVNLMLNHTD